MAASAECMNDDTGKFRLFWARVVARNRASDLLRWIRRRIHGDSCHLVPYGPAHVGPVDRHLPSSESLWRFFITRKASF